MPDETRRRVLIAEPQDFSEGALDLLRAVAAVDLMEVDRPGLEAAVEQYDAVWIRLGHRIDAALVARATRCRVIATAVTGLDHVDLAACGARGIEVLSLRGEVEFLKEVRATAEHTIGLALALIRRLPSAGASVVDGAWDRDRFRGSELYRKTAGIVGVGRLGRIVGSLFGAFGMEVVGVDQGPFDEPGIETAASLHDLLARADVVSLHVPLNDDTRHLIGARELLAMKRNAVLINTSRGAVVDDAALVESLRAGTIAGAALDVVEGEPSVGANHPLVRYAREHDNLVITPHIGGNTHESFDKTEVFLAKKVVQRLEALT